MRRRVFFTRRILADLMEFPMAHVAKSSQLLV